MTFSQAYNGDRFALSFELFPPKTAAGMKVLLGHVQRLMVHEPCIVTCTYGAGGSNQDRTLQVIAAVREQHEIPMATHLTCVGRTAEQLREYLQRAESLGVADVVALRGDPPQDQSSFSPTAGGFAYANELVAFIRSEVPSFDIAVGGYPETHQEAPSAAVDLENLKRKVDAGASAVITQLFYDNRDFDNFRERAEQAGIGVPIVPGLLPVTNLAQIQRIASLCGARLPDEFVAALTKFADDAEGQFEVGVEFAARQAQELVDAGVPGIHFYVLNKSQATGRVLESIAVPGRVR